ncbi:MAG TPA: hypothetical protein VGD94_19230 [Vicinamibacterales bacterium]
MRIGTVVKASRKHIGILVVFDGDDRPTAYTHDDVVNRAEDMTDLLDGRGVRIGMRVESLPENKLRLTGEAFAAEPEPDPVSPRGLDTPEKFMAWAKSQGAAGRLDAWIAASGSGAPMPFDPDDLDALLDK